MQKWKTFSNSSQASNKSQILTTWEEVLPAVDEDRPGVGWIAGRGVSHEVQQGDRERGRAVVGPGGEVPLFDLDLGARRWGRRRAVQRPGRVYWLAEGDALDRGTNESINQV